MTRQSETNFHESWRLRIRDSSKHRRYRSQITHFGCVLSAAAASDGGPRSQNEPSLSFEQILISIRIISLATESSLVKSGLPSSSWTYLECAGFTKPEIASVIDTSPKTIQRKESRAEALGVAEGDRTMRFLRIVAEAVEAIGDYDKGMQWLRSSSLFLQGKTPLEMIATEAGAALVRQSLGVIEYGGVA